MNMNTFGIYLIQPSPDWRFDALHRHTWHELVYVSAGTYHVEVDGREYDVQEQQCCCYPAGTLHAPHPETDRSCMFYVLQFYNPNPPAVTHPFAIQDDPGLRMRDLLDWIWEYSLAPGPALQEHYQDIQRTIVTYWNAMNHTPTEQEDADNLRMMRAQRYLEANLHFSITLDDVARFMKISRAQTVRFFKAHTEETPMRYLRKMRVQKAIRMLRSTAYSWSEIVDKTGLGSPVYGTRMLKQYTGKTPSDIRKGEE